MVDNQVRNDRKRLVVVVQDDVDNELDQIAHEESNPGHLVNKSELIREAIHDLIEDYRRDERTLHPHERGQVEGHELQEINVDEGAA